MRKHLNVMNIQAVGSTLHLCSIKKRKHMKVMCKRCVGSSERTANHMYVGVGKWL